MDKETDYNSEILATLTKIAENFQFPINNKRQFTENLNKDGLKVDSKFIRAHIDSIDADLVKNIIPAYYFPIADKEDFVDKVMDLYKYAKSNLLTTYSEGPLFPDPNDPSKERPPKGGW